MIEVEPHWSCVELVSEALSRLDHFEYAVHSCGVDTVEVHRVRVTSRVGEVHLQPVTFSTSEGRSRDGPVVRPRGEVDARRDLDFTIHRGDLVFPLNLAVRERRYVCRSRTS